MLLEEAWEETSEGDVGGPRPSVSLCQHFKRKSRHFGGGKCCGAVRLLAGQFQVRVWDMFVRELAEVCPLAGGLVRREACVRARVRGQGETCRRGDW